MVDQNLLMEKRPLNSVEIGRVIASTILKLNLSGAMIDPSALTNGEFCAMTLGSSGNARVEFAGINRNTFPDAANTFVNRLIKSGVLEHDWATGRSGIYKLSPEMTTSLEVIITLEGMEISEFVDTLDDSELKKRCEIVVLRAGKPDSLLREAMTVLEDRLNSYSLEGKSGGRRNLPARILHPKTGSHKTFTDTAIQEDFFYLVRGLLGFYGSEVHHRLIEDLTIKTVSRVVVMVDEVLVLLSMPAIHLDNVDLISTCEST